MSLPEEQVRSIFYMRRFLQSMLDPKKTPKIPRKYRTAAYSTIRHAPSVYCLRTFFKKEFHTLLDSLERQADKDNG